MFKKVLFFLFLFVIPIYSQLVKTEYLGMTLDRFDELKWKVSRIDTQWSSRENHIYTGEIWIFTSNSYDSVEVPGKWLKYFFHNNKLWAIQFAHFTFDSLEILKTLEQFTQIISDNGNPHFHADLVGGGAWPGVGGPTLSLTKVYRTFVPHAVPDGWRLNHSGTLIVNFSRHYYSIKNNWPGGPEPYHIVLNFYPKTYGDPGYGPNVPEKVITDTIQISNN